MKNRYPNGKSLISIGVLGVMLLSVGAEPASAASFPRATCRPGFIQAGPRLCIDQVAQGAVDINTAMVLCRNRFASVASYGDLYYLYLNTTLDGNYNPFGRWLGPDHSADDQALIGNNPITSDGDEGQENFDGTGLVVNIGGGGGIPRQYWCAHDDNKN